MSFKSAMRSLLNGLNMGPFAEDNSRPNLPSGGHTGYHPVTRSRRRRTDAAGYAESQPQAGWNPPAQENGYTGYQPQAGYGQTGYQSQFAGQGGQQGYQPQFGGQPMQAEYQPQFTGRQQAAGYQRQFDQAAQATGYAGNQPQPAGQTAFGQGFGQAQQQEQPRNNISFMPNVMEGTNGAGYRHIEHLVQPLSASSCYRLMEFMRRGETVVVNTELIRDERENQRCLDLLFGAAFTMQCTFTRIANRSIYLIAPRDVEVVPYPSMRDLGDQDRETRWPGAYENGTQSAHQMGEGRPSRIVRESFASYAAGGDRAYR